MGRGGRAAKKGVLGGSEQKGEMWECNGKEECIVQILDECQPCLGLKGMLLLCDWKHLQRFVQLINGGQQQMFQHLFNKIVRMSLGTTLPVVMLEAALIRSISLVHSCLFICQSRNQRPLFMGSARRSTEEHSSCAASANPNTIAA